MRSIYPPLLKLLLLGLLSLLLASQLLQASYQLKNIPYLDSCPFLQSDHYAADINRLHDIISAQLHSKVVGNQACQGPFKSIAQNLATIDELFQANRNPNLLQDITDEVLNKQLLQLETDLRVASSDSPAYQEIAKKIRDIEDNIYKNKISLQFNRDYFQETRDNAALSSTFNYMNEVVMTMANLPAPCIEQLGGWQTVIPTMLNSISSLSGLSGFAFGPLIGAGLQLISSLTLLLQDLEVKNALKNMIRHRNSKILACTYFAIQNTACEYKRALKISQEETRIKNFINDKYSNLDTSFFETYFAMLDFSHNLHKVFMELASMGSALTLDPALINRYFVAQRIGIPSLLSPLELGLPPDPQEEGEDADARRQLWLNAAQERGITFQETLIKDKVLLGLRPLADQVKEALNDINLKKFDIAQLEKNLESRRSFVDLKHELEADPSFTQKLTTFIAFLVQTLQQPLIPAERQSALTDALRILVALRDFLSSDLPPFPTQATQTLALGSEQSAAYLHYQQEVNQRGQELFTIMAEGSIAQLNQQSVLAVGSKVSQRVNRALRLIEIAFLTAEFTQKQEQSASSTAIKYSEYKRDRNLLTKVVHNYQAFVGSGKTFRSEDIAVAMTALEKGFGKEIKRMLSASLKTRSPFYPDLEGETASHLCALYSLYLQKKGGLRFEAKNLLKKCQTKFSELELLKIMQPQRLPIAWNDPCYYYDYHRLFSIQKGLYRKILSLGLNIDPRDQALIPLQNLSLDQWPRQNNR